GNSAEFVASGGVNYLWNTGENSNTLTVNDDQIHIVTVTDINGCTDIEEKTLTLQANPDAGNDQNVNCFATDFATLTGTGSGTWTLGSGPGTATIVTPDANSTVVE